MHLGFLGVGAIGRPMAERLLDVGFTLHVCDVREEAMRPLLDKQARRAESPRALADLCETVVVSLPTLPVFRQVVQGAEGLLAGRTLKTVVNTCTVGGPFVRELEQDCASKGVTVVDAPVSGGVVAASEGALVVMVSGDKHRVEELMPVFRAWGSRVVIAGDKPGAAQTMKLTNNVLCAVNLIATSEALALSNKAGIPTEAMLEIINGATGRNFASSVIFPNNVLPGTYDYGATLNILMKDVDLAIKQGEELGIPMWVCQAARLVLKHGTFQGWGEKDMAYALPMIEDVARGGVSQPSS